MDGKKLNDKQILEFIKPTIDKLYEDYKYIEMSKSEYEDLILKVIENIKSNNISQKYLKQIVKNSFQLKIKKLILNDNTSFKVINNYINQYLNNIYNYPDALDFFNKLSLFFNINEYMPTPEIVMELIENNSIFNQATNLIIKNNYQKVKNGDITKINNNLIVLVIDSYCILNDIEIDNNIEKEIESSEDLDIVKQYFNEIGKYPLLSKDKEKELALKIRQGDKQAKDIFIKSNLRLVASVAKRYVGKGLLLLDLIQEGNIGLMKAVEMYDVERGYKFSTYATWWIRQTIARAIMDKSKNIRIPVHRFEKFVSYTRVINDLTMRLNRTPSKEEVAKELNISIKEIDYLNDLMLDTVSLNVPVGEEKDAELGEFIESNDKLIDDIVISNELPKRVEELFKQAKLKDNEIDILKLRFGFDNQPSLTLQEIAEKYNVTRERIRQIQQNALFKLRKLKNIKYFSDYTDNPSQSLQFIEDVRKTCDGNISYFAYKNNTAKVSNKKGEKKTIYQYFRNYTKEQVDEVIDSLSEKEKKLIYLKYGDDLNVPVYNKLTNIKDRQHFGNLITKIKKILKNNVLDKYYEEELEVLKDFSVNKIFLDLSCKEAIIVCLKLVFLDGKCYETENIASFLNVKKEEVIEITKNSLLFYKKMIDLYMNPAIDYVYNSLENEKVKGGKK